MSKTRVTGINKDDRTGLYGFVVDITPPGVRPRRQARRRGYKTLSEAQAARDALRSELVQQKFVPPRRLTLGDYLEQHWLPAIESTVRRSTFDSYSRNIRLHVKPHAIAGVQLQAITPPMLTALYGDLMRGGDRKPLSARSVAYIATIVHRALREAVKWQYAPRNAAADASPPRPKTQDGRTITTWSGADVQRFLVATASDRLAALWRLLATTGCRRGEALGLRWADVDLDAARMTITRALVEREAAPGYAFESPKTAAGARTVSLDAMTVTALRAHKTRQSKERLLVGTGWREHDLVFCRPDGQPLHPKTVGTLFTDAVKRHGLPHLSCHGLRHTWATLALQSRKVSPRVVQARLGHSHVSITLGIYSHVTADLDVAAAEEIAAMIAGGSPS